MSKPNLSVAVLGCGAIAEHAHLPAAEGIPGVRLSALVDRDLRRAEVLAERHGVEVAVTEWKQLAERPDAVIVALPHSLHATASRELLEQGIHVLVEKPMALSTADCDTMIAAAAASGTQLAVGLVRRFLPEVRQAKALLDAGVLGCIHGCDAREGRVFDWSVTTDSLFRKQTAGGGVLTDLGIHTLDTLLFLLGDATPTRYADDSFGGVEAEAEIRLDLATGGTADVELSRTRNLRNSFLVRGEHAALEVDLVAHGLRLRIGDETIGVDTTPTGSDEPDVFRAQLADWVEAIRTNRPPEVPGSEGRRSVALIEACYALRRPLDLPWTDPNRRFGNEESP